MCLEFAVARYPTPVRLRDGKICTVRLLESEDADRFYEFLKAVPEEERLFIKPRLTLRLIRRWCRQSKPDENLTLVMVHNDRIIGEATLHQRTGGWKRHIGKVTVLTHPHYRGIDVAKLLVKELLAIAPHCGLERLEAEFNGERQVAIRALFQLGFEELARIPGYLRDMRFRPHDYVLLGIHLVTDEEYAVAVG
ncbi:MAG: GNAT family N-acetyltransferase [Verrucomicrobiota bacterium]|nr:GNAT family N-acetyltransferase [Limisphaera sp.]MDW8382115.1 GNAT family N-acetyltransferase [Verrucomicrobiota bacterium]